LSFCSLETNAWLPQAGRLKVGGLQFFMTRFEKFARKFMKQYRDAAPAVRSEEACGKLIPEA
jgi:hypothetical protein